jgi:sirohydrochlorin ferrochelatase
MNALIILAHGSRRAESNQEVVSLTEAVNAISNQEYSIIEYAYLELAEPGLLQSIDNVIVQGALNITVFPYFLNSGNHVKRDIPAIIETASVKYPDCDFNVSTFIGMHRDIPGLILELARMK